MEKQYKRKNGKKGLFKLRTEHFDSINQDRQINEHNLGYNLEALISNQNEILKKFLIGKDMPYKWGVGYKIKNMNYGLSGYLKAVGDENLDYSLVAASNISCELNLLEQDLKAENIHSSLVRAMRLITFSKEFILALAENEILAGLSRTGEATTEKKEISQNLKLNAIKLAKEEKIKNPLHSKKRIAAKISPKLNRSTSTVNGYLKGIKI